VLDTEAGTHRSVYALTELCGDNKHRSTRCAPRARSRMGVTSLATGLRAAETVRRTSDARCTERHDQSRITHKADSTLTRGSPPQDAEATWCRQPGHDGDTTNAPKHACGDRHTASSLDSAEARRVVRTPPQRRAETHRMTKLDSPVIGLQGSEPRRDPYPTCAVLRAPAGRSSLGFDPLQGVLLTALTLCKDNISSLGLFMCAGHKDPHT